MQQVLNLLEVIINESYMSSQLDQDGLADRVFETCSLFYYKVKLYNINNVTQIQKLYNDLRLSRFVDGNTLIEPSYPLLWLTEVSQKLFLRLDSLEEFKDKSLDVKISQIVDLLVPVLIYHSNTVALIEDPVFQTTLSHAEWVDLLTKNSWLLVGCLIRFLPVTIFSEMLETVEEEDNNEVNNIN